MSQLNSFLHKLLNNILGVGIQYFVITGIVFFVFFVWKKKAMWYANIQQKYPGNQHIKRELFYSCTSVLMLATFITLVVWLNKHGYTRAYKPIDKYGWPYYFFSMFLMLLVHDTYYYWTHRLLHWRPLFKYVHKIHHVSTNPTPFAAYSFHPLEGVIQLGVLFVIVFTIPHHSSAVTFFALYSFIVNVGWHLGHEFLPRWFVRHKLFKWHNTSTHHNLHHTNVKSNYGFYFNFWDTIMKTNSKNYHEHFEMVADRRDETKALNKAKSAQPAKPEPKTDDSVRIGQPQSAV